MNILNTSPVGLFAISGFGLAFYTLCQLLKLRNELFQIKETLKQLQERDKIDKG